MDRNKEAKPYINTDYFEDLTGDIPDKSGKEVQEIGSRIQTLRQEKGLSLEELSAKTGFDVQSLSRIEQGEVQPQLGAIIKLSKALDAALGSLISGEGDRPYAITRKDERKRISRSTAPKRQEELYAYMSLAPEVKGRHMEPLVVQLKENPEEETSTHDGEEFIFVLDGVVLFKIGQERFELEPGDSVYYQSATPHLVAAKEGTATILAVLHEG
jgi:transcriptional regulator with XRE-family HTH domain